MVKLVAVFSGEFETSPPYRRMGINAALRECRSIKRRESRLFERVLNSPGNGTRRPGNEAPLCAANS